MFTSKRSSRFLLLVSCVFWMATGFSAYAAKPPTLSNDQAFIPQVTMNSGESITATWRIADGYYLYKEKFEFNVASNDFVKLGVIEFPQGDIKQDKYFGTQEVYHDEVSIHIPIMASEPGDFTFQVKYQGCAEEGICYSPKRKTYNFSVATVTTTLDENGSAGAVDVNKAEVSDSVVKTQESRLTTLLQEGHFLTIMGVFFLGGLALTFTPCVLPMIPILSSIIVGQKKELKRRECFALSFSYVLGMAITYSVLGVVLGVAGNNIVAYLQNPWVISIFAGMFVLLSLSMFGLYELQLPQGIQNKLNTLNNKQQGGTYIGTLIMGVLSALIVSPCVSAPLAGALVYISTTDGGAFLGGSALFALSMGMGTPLIIMGTGGAHLIPSSGQWMNGVKAFFGVMLLAVAVWFLDRIIPSAATLALWGALLLGCGIYLGGLDFGSKEGWAQFRKTIGFVSVLYGSLMWIGAAGGGTNPFQPLEKMNIASTDADSPVKNSDINAQFSTVFNLEQLQIELANAAQQNKPVFLDFFAEWCVSCKVMEHEVFPDPAIEARLKTFYLIRADVTDSSELLDHYGLFGPPSLLFFDGDGAELAELHIRSEIHAEELAPHLDSVIRISQKDGMTVDKNLALYY